MFSSCFTMSEQEHRQWTPYKHGAVYELSTQAGMYIALQIDTTLIGAHSYETARDHLSGGRRY